jgi:hypothetical protein
MQMALIPAANQNLITQSPIKIVVCFNHATQKQTPNSELVMRRKFTLIFAISTVV